MTALREKRTYTGGPRQFRRRVFPPAETAFFQEQQQYQVLVERAPLGITLIDSQGWYKYVNPKFVEMFGYSREDIPTGQEWFAKAYPDAAYRDQVISDWKLYLEESRGDEAEPRTFTVTCKDGSVKVIKFRAVPLEGGEQFILYEDVTELQQAEDSLQVCQPRLHTPNYLLAVPLERGTTNRRLAWILKNTEALG